MYIWLKKKQVTLILSLKHLTKSSCVNIERLPCDANLSFIYKIKTRKLVQRGNSYEAAKLTFFSSNSKPESLINPFQPSVAFHVEISHLTCCANQIAGFYMK